MFGFGILTGLVFLPLVGVAFILALRGDDEATKTNARWAALATTIITFVLSLVAYAQLDLSSSAFQLVEEKHWFGGGLVYKLGLDGLSAPFVVLTTFLMPFCILASWQSIQNRVKEYMIAFLVLETLMIGVFCALDLVLFLSVLRGRPHSDVPHHRHLGRQKRRVYAAFKFFLYTLLGSLLMLVAIMAMYTYAGTTDITVLLKTDRSRRRMQKWLWLAFFASFAVKMPMWPVHTWLPDAHVEAPTAGSVILAGVLLKMGGYGFLRFSLPMFPDASLYFAPLIYALSVIAIIYTSLVALVQTDMKKLIAYSSIAHMGFVTIGLFSMTQQGIQGAIFLMISHGLVSGALFLCVGVVYDRMHTREIAAYGGLVERMPLYAVAFMIFTMANIGLPGTSGFIGEFLTMLGVFRVNTWVAAFAALGYDPFGRLRALSLSPRHLRRARTSQACRTFSICRRARSPCWRRLFFSSSITACIRGRSSTAPPIRSRASFTSAGATFASAHPAALQLAGFIRMSTFGFLFALSHCLPEAILTVGVLALILVGAIRDTGRTSSSPSLRSAFLASRCLSLFSGKANAVIFGGAFIDDGFGRFAKGLCYVGSIVTLLISHHFLVQEKINKFEFPVLVLLSTLGMSLLISANGLIALYLGLELMSLALYVVAAFHRDNAKASEAGLKYFVLGALSSGMLLYGASLLYGFAGTVSFAGIASAVSWHPVARRRSSASSS